MDYYRMYSKMACKLCVSLYGVDCTVACVTTSDE